MYTRTTFHQSESTIDPMFSDLSHQQEETSSLGFLSPPNIQSFLGQSITNISREVCLYYLYCKKKSKFLVFLEGTVVK